MNNKLRVLLVEDSETDATLVVAELKRGGYEVSYDRVDSAAAMTSALDRQEWDIILSDFSMPSFSGEAALALAQQAKLDLPFIIISGTIEEEAAVSALKAGANDFLTKGRLARLVPSIERALRDAQSRREKKMAEEQLRKKQKMEAIGQLAGGIAHDFNNLLTVILGHSELMLERLPPDSPLRREVDLIRRTSERAAALTRQLLTFSRRQAMEAKMLSLNTVVSDMQSLLRRLIREDIDLRVALAPSLRQVKADPSQLEQVLINLVVNARDAMPNGGNLTIETAEVQLDESYARTHLEAQAGRYVMLAVTDTGCGMTPEVKTRIFEPFFTTKEPGKGTGLGLSTVYGIVKQSGGQVEVYSELGRGTTFKVYLPEAEGHRRAVSTMLLPAVVQQTGAETVLVVEDEQGVRDLVHDTLLLLGYKVLLARNGREARQMMTAQAGQPAPRVNLLITDMVMPEMGGQELAAELSARFPDLKILFTSGYTEQAIAHNAAVDPNFFLQKPFTPKALAKKVREVLSAPSLAK